MVKPDPIHFHNKPEPSVFLGMKVLILIVRGYCLDSHLIYINGFPRAKDPHVSGKLLCRVLFCDNDRC